MDIVIKLQNQEKCLRDYFQERDDVIRALFLSIITYLHIVLVGPPGTGKSYIIECFQQGFKGMKSFDYQVNKFTMPEELFGPLSFKQLKEDKYVRLTEGYLPDADIAYLDELFNANSAILNHCNECLNERTFKKIPIRLKTVLTATNFIPEEKNLQAFFDRLMFRFIVKEIMDETKFMKMLSQKSYQLDPKYQITLDELAELHKRLDTISTNNIIQLLADIRIELKKLGLNPSSRRFRQCILVLKAVALFEGRDRVQPEDLIYLKDILWSDPKDIPEVESLICSKSDPWGSAIKNYKEQLIEIRDDLASIDPDNDENALKQLQEYLKKMKKIEQTINDELVNNPKTTRRVQEQCVVLLTNIKKMREDAVYKLGLG